MKLAFVETPQPITLKEVFQRRIATAPNQILKEAFGSPLARHSSYWTEVGGIRLLFIGTQKFIRETAKRATHPSLSWGDLFSYQELGGRAFFGLEDGIEGGSVVGGEFRGDVPIAALGSNSSIFLAQQKITSSNAHLGLDGLFVGRYANEEAFCEAFEVAIIRHLADYVPIVADHAA